MQNVKARAYILKLCFLLFSLSIFLSCSFSQKPTVEEKRSKAIDFIVDGEKQESLGEYVVAIKIYDESLGLSERPRAYYNLGHSYMKLSEYEKAIINFEKAVELAKNYRIAKTELAQAKEILKSGTDKNKSSYLLPSNTDLESAKVKDVESMQLSLVSDSAVKADRDKLSSTVTLAQISGPEETLSPVQLPPEQTSQTEADKKKPVPTVEDVNAYLKDGVKKEQAETDTTKFGKDSRIALNDFVFHKEKARKYVEVKRYDYALSEYREALKLNPGDSESLIELSAVYEKMGNPEKSLEMLKTLETKESKNPKIFFNIANMRRMMGEYEEALKYYNKALELDSANPVIMNHIGYIYKKMGDYDKSENAYLQAIVASPGYVNTYINLGILYDDFLNDNEKALSYYKKYLELGGERKAEVNKWIMDIEK